MNLTLSVDEQTVNRARKKAQALGKSLNQLIREYLQRLAGGDDAVPRGDGRSARDNVHGSRKYYTR